MKVELSNMTQLDVKLSNQEILDNTKEILFTIYHIMKKGEPNYSTYLFNDVFTVINSIHENPNYIKFEITNADQFSYDLIKLLLSYKHEYLKVFNLVHIDNNELILPIENKRKFYDLIRIIK